MAEVLNPDFWRDVQPGSIVVLSDAQALVEAVRQGLDGDGGLNYEVKRILRVKSLNDLAEWMLLRLEGADDVWLMVKIAGQAVDLRIYFEVPEFPAGNRADLIAAEMYWLFEDPGPDWQAKYNDLKFTDRIDIDQGPGNQGPATQTRYHVKPFGAQYGTCTELPSEPGAAPSLATIVEYLTADPTDNPELLILELGGEGDPHGGYIQMMLGCSMAPSDVRVFKK
ncbi:hypothetical protein DESC_740051 [Desulfosarcina cetonica]|uniref:hypothetical protein n=1 Tax=Desulfosarcina cetonica TaxID=90730 RepID=UPI0006D20AF5|nr:hypothetical protein [Desulfosarcina cetonica]VTR69312.1 hypothetical protein DESC_740051 [Desulfosarcina cetonica]